MMKYKLELLECVSIVSIIYYIADGNSGYKWNKLW